MYFPMRTQRRYNFIRRRSNVMDGVCGQSNKYTFHECRVWWKVHEKFLHLSNKLMDKSACFPSFFRSRLESFFFNLIGQKTALIVPKFYWLKQKSHNHNIPKDLNYGIHNWYFRSSGIKYNWQTTQYLYLTKLAINKFLNPKVAFWSTFNPMFEEFYITVKGSSFGVVMFSR